MTQDTKPTAITRDYLQGIPLPRPEEDSDKDQRGRVLVIAGSVPVPGGALLAATGALRAGAGKLQVATCASVAPHLGLALPEALVLGLPETPDGGIAPSAADLLAPRIERCDAVLIGPGMMDEDAVAGLTADLLRRSEGATFVLDAGALTGLRQAEDALRRHQGRIVLTPHAGEMAGLLGVEKRAVAADPLGTARRAADLLHAVVALKGARTTIVTPEGEASSYAGGNVGLATSGSGDTLAGIIVGLLARGTPPVQATQWGVYLHGEAGNRLARARGPIGFLARELLAEVPGVMAEFAR